MSFRAILERLVHEHDTVHAAIFCDDEGERVDAATKGALDAYEVDLHGAAFAPVVSQLPVDALLRVVQGRRALWLARVAERYYLVVVCQPGRDGPMRGHMLSVSTALAAAL